MNILDYYFRHDRGAFWMYNNCVNDSFLFRAFNPLINSASDKKYIPQNIMKILLEYRSITVQDAVVPLDNMSNILNFMDQNYNIYPIWFCPCLNLDATLQQKKIAYNQIKCYIRLILQGNEDITNIFIHYINKDGFHQLVIFIYMYINYNKDMEELARILDLTSTISYYLVDSNNLFNLIETNKKFIYENKYNLLLNELKLYLSKKEKYIEKFMYILLDCIKIKTAYFGLVQCNSNTDYFIDIGIYGKSNIIVENKLNKLENFTLQNKGIMGQYAITTLSREDYETIILKKDWYNYLRNKYYADMKYPDIYDKLGP